MKGQSNPEIARTPRKAFRCCLRCSAQEVERPFGCEGFTAYQVLPNSECLRAKPRRKGAGANVRSREEKNPARMLAWKQPFIQRVRNSSLVEESGMDNNRV